MLTSPIIALVESRLLSEFLTVSQQPIINAPTADLTCLQLTVVDFQPSKLSQKSCVWMLTSPIIPLVESRLRRKFLTVSQQPIINAPSADLTSCS